MSLAKKMATNLLITIAIVWQRRTGTRARERKIRRWSADIVHPRTMEWSRAENGNLPGRAPCCIEWRDP